MSDYFHDAEDMLDAFGFYDHLGHPSSLSGDSDHVSDSENSSSADENDFLMDGGGGADQTITAGDEESQCSSTKYADEILPDLNNLYDSVKLINDIRSLPMLQIKNKLTDLATKLTNYFEVRRSRGDRIISRSQVLETLMDWKFSDWEASRICDYFDTENAGRIDVIRGRRLMDNEISWSTIGDSSFIERTLQYCDLLPGLADICFENKASSDIYRQRLIKRIEQSTFNSEQTPILADPELDSVLRMRRQLIRYWLDTCAVSPRSCDVNGNQQFDNTALPGASHGHSTKRIPVERCFESIKTSSNEAEASNLTDNNPKTYWQSNGEAGRHWILIRMRKDTIVGRLMINVAAIDQSYMPQSVSVFGGRRVWDMEPLEETNVASTSTGDILIAQNLNRHYRLLRIDITSCHGGGCDTRVRGLKIKSYRLSPSVGGSLRPNSCSLPTTLNESTAVLFLNLLTSAVLTESTVGAPLRLMAVTHGMLFARSLTPLICFGDVLPSKSGGAAANTAVTPKILDAIESAFRQIFEKDPQCCSPWTAIEFLLNTALARADLNSLMLGIGRFLRMEHATTVPEDFRRSLLQKLDHFNRQFFDSYSQSLRRINAKVIGQTDSTPLTSFTTKTCPTPDAAHLAEIILETCQHSVIMLTRLCVQFSSRAKTDVRVYALPSTFDQSSLNGDGYRRLQELSHAEFDQKDKSLSTVFAGCVYTTDLYIRVMSTQRVEIHSISLFGFNDFSAKDSHLMHRLKMQDVFRDRTPSIPDCTTMIIRLLSFADTILTLARAYKLEPLANALSTSHPVDAKILISCMDALTNTSKNDGNVRLALLLLVESLFDNDCVAIGDHGQQLLQKLPEFASIDGQSSELVAGVLTAGMPLFYSTAEQRREKLFTLLNGSNLLECSLIERGTLVALCQRFSVGGADVDEFLKLPLKSNDSEPNQEEETISTFRTLYTCYNRHLIVRSANAGAKDNANHRDDVVQQILLDLSKVITAQQMRFIVWCRQNSSESLTWSLLLSVLRVTLRCIRELLDELDLNDWVQDVPLAYQGFLSASSVLLEQEATTVPIDADSLTMVFQEWSKTMKPQIAERFSDSVNKMVSAKRISFNRQGTDTQTELRRWNVESPHPYERPFQFQRVFRQPGALVFDVDFDYPVCSANIGNDQMTFITDDGSRFRWQGANKTVWPQRVSIRSRDKLSFEFMAETSLSLAVPLVGFKFSVSARSLANCSFDDQCADLAVTLAQFGGNLTSLILRQAPVNVLLRDNCRLAHCNSTNQPGKTAFVEIDADINQNLKRSLMETCDDWATDSVMQQLTSHVQFDDILYDMQKLLVVDHDQKADANLKVVEMRNWLHLSAQLTQFLNEFLGPTSKQHSLLHLIYLQSTSGLRRLLDSSLVQILDDKLSVNLWKALLQAANSELTSEYARCQWSLLTLRLWPRDRLIDDETTVSMANFLFNMALRQRLYVQKSIIDEEIINEARYAKFQRWLEVETSFLDEEIKNSSSYMSELKRDPKDECLFRSIYSRRLGDKKRCDGCRGALIRIRYRCLDCLDTDLCSKCATGGVGPVGHMDEHRLVMLNFVCDECNGYIVGSRFNCNARQHFDLCFGCRHTTKTSQDQTSASDNVANDYTMHKTYYIRQCMAETKLIYNYCSNLAWLTCAYIITADGQQMTSILFKVGFELLTNMTKQSAGPDGVDGHSSSNVETKVMERFLGLVSLALQRNNGTGADWIDRALVFCFHYLKSENDYAWIWSLFGRLLTSAGPSVSDRALNETSRTPVDGYPEGLLSLQFLFMFGCQSLLSDNSRLVYSISTLFRRLCDIPSWSPLTGVCLRSRLRNSDNDCRIFAALILNGFPEIFCRGINVDYVDFCGEVCRGVVIDQTLAGDSYETLGEGRRHTEAIPQRDVTYRRSSSMSECKEIIDASELQVDWQLLIHTIDWNSAADYKSIFAAALIMKALRSAIRALPTVADWPDQIFDQDFCCSLLSIAGRSTSLRANSRAEIAEKVFLELSNEKSAFDAAKVFLDNDRAYAELFVERSLHLSPLQGDLHVPVPIILAVYEMANDHGKNADWEIKRQFFSPGLMPWTRQGAISAAKWARTSCRGRSRTGELGCNMAQYVAADVGLRLMKSDEYSSNDTDPISTLGDSNHEPIAVNDDDEYATGGCFPASFTNGDADSKSYQPTDNLASTLLLLDAVKSCCSWNEVMKRIAEATLIFYARQMLGELLSKWPDSRPLDCLQFGLQTYEHFVNVADLLRCTDKCSDIADDVLRVVYKRRSLTADEGIWWRFACRMLENGLEKASVCLLKNGPATVIKLPNADAVLIQRCPDTTCDANVVFHVEKNRSRTVDGMTTFDLIFPSHPSIYVYLKAKSSAEPLPAGSSLSLKITAKRADQFDTGWKLLTMILEEDSLMPSLNRIWARLINAACTTTGRQRHLLIDLLQSVVERCLYGKSVEEERRPDLTLASPLWKLLEELDTDKTEHRLHPSETQRHLMEFFYSLRRLVVKWNLVESFGLRTVDKKPFVNSYIRGCKTVAALCAAIGQENHLTEWFVSTSASEKQSSQTPLQNAAYARHWSDISSHIHDTMSTWINNIFDRANVIIMETESESDDDFC